MSVNTHSHRTFLEPGHTRPPDEAYPDRLLGAARMLADAGAVHVLQIRVRKEESEKA